MTVTEPLLYQGTGIVRGIEVLESIEPTGPTERAQALSLLQTYRRPVIAVVRVVLGLLADEDLNANQRTGTD